jgi:hypothetical protein
MGLNSIRLVITLCLLAGSSQRAAASGVLKTLPLKDAAARSRIVLVVELAAPATRQVEHVASYVEDKTKAKKSITLRRTLYRFKVIASLHSADKDGPRVASVIDVLDSHVPLGEMVALAMRSGGASPIPIYDDLDGKATPAAKGRFVLLLSVYDAKDKVYIGVAGLGLLPIARQAEVEKLIRARPR